MKVLNLLESYWWIILILLVGGVMMAKKCPSNCTKNWMAGCECHGPAVVRN